MKDKQRDPGLPPGFGDSDLFIRKLKYPVEVKPEFGLSTSRRTETTEDGLFVAILLALEQSPTGKVVLIEKRKKQEARAYNLLKEYHA